MRAMSGGLRRDPEREAAPRVESAADHPRDVSDSPAVRWEDRPVLAGALRALSSLLPLLASTAVAWLLARALSLPQSTAGRALWWFGVASASLVALVAFDRLARRLLPLAALLKLSMVFPDRAPSRLGVALRSGSTRRLQERALHDLQEGKQEPAAAASTIIMLAASLSAHDRGTRGHSERVRAYADLIAEELGLGRSERDRLRWAALLHDLGKLSVPASTLNAHDALTADDWATLRRHPLEGARLAAPLRGWLGTWATAIEQHHERYDGTGYPYGLAGEQLSLAARIVAVADSYDAMTSVRSYSPGMAPAAARQELARKAGTDFDPAVVRAFLNVGLGRVRWVMGPLAFLSIVPFAPGLGGLRHAAVSAGRTVALGTASLAAATAVVVPQLDTAPPPPSQVLSGRAAPPAVPPTPAGRPSATSQSAETASAGAVEAPPGRSGEPGAAPVDRPAGRRSVGSRAPREAPPPSEAVPAPPVAPAPVPAMTPVERDAAPPPPAPAEKDPPPACPKPDKPDTPGKPGDAAAKCPPKWGHTDERPPKAGGKDDPAPRQR